MAEPLTPEQVIELLEVRLLGSNPTLTGLDIAEDVGIDMEVARSRWRSLGFTAVEDDVLAFTEADLEAMRLTQLLHEVGLIDSEEEAALIRTLGRSFARLAEWQLTLLGEALGPTELDGDGLGAVVDTVIPVVERVQNYIWRRHLLSAASRMLLGPAAGEEAGTGTGIGFADIVGYTRQTRSLTQEELAALVEHFESRSLAIVTAHQGRIIKTIGDEILFAADTAVDAAEIALELVEAHHEDEDFPELRVGTAWGPVLQRFGDVFGPTVNIASRLTRLARPGRVLIDKDLAEQLADDESFKLRRLRRTSVRGYRRLEPWNLRRSGDEDLPAVAAQIRDRGQDLLRAVDDIQRRGERSAEEGEESESESD